MADQTFLDSGDFETYSALQAKAGNLFLVSYENNLPLSGTEQGILYLNNAGSKNVELQYLQLAIFNTINTRIIFRLYRNPTITVNGGVLTPLNLNSGSVNPTTIQVFNGPTASALGTRLGGWHINSVGPSTHETVFNSNIIIAPGHSLLLTGAPDGVNRNCQITFCWVER